MEQPFWTLIVAAGCGQRFGAARPKQYLDLAGLPVLVRAIDPFVEHGDPERIILVIPPEDGEFILDMLATHRPGLRPLLVPGGATRQNSVYRGLSAIADEDGLVAVHDAARPLFDGGPSDKPEFRWTFGGLIVGTDPAAVDSTGINILEKKRHEFHKEARPLEHGRRMVRWAQKIGVGHADEKLIDLVRIELD